jgi:hypothetical protein
MRGNELTDVLEEFQPKAITSDTRTIDEDKHTGGERKKRQDVFLDVSVITSNPR